MEGTPINTRPQREERESSMEPRSSNMSSSDEGVEAPKRLVSETYDTGKKHLKHRAEIVQGKLKQMRMKKVNGPQVEDPKAARPLWPSKDEEVKRLKDKEGDAVLKRKRLSVEEMQISTGDEAEADVETVATLDSPSKLAPSESKLSRQGSGKKLSKSVSSVVDPTKPVKDGPRKPKRTGEDGVSHFFYFIAVWVYSLGSPLSSFTGEHFLLNLSVKEDCQLRGTSIEGHTRYLLSRRSEQQGIKPVVD